MIIIYLIAWIIAWPFFVIAILLKTTIEILISPNKVYFSMVKNIQEELKKETK